MVRASDMQLDFYVVVRFPILKSNVLFMRRVEIRSSQTTTASSKAGKSRTCSS